MTTVAPLGRRGTAVAGEADLVGRLEPGEAGKGPVLVVGDRRIPWALIGEVLAGQTGVEVTLRVAARRAAAVDPVVVVDEPPSGGRSLTVVPPEPEPHPPLRPPVDDVEAEAWAEAVTLMDECLLPEHRHPCPAAALRAACHIARVAAEEGDGVWTPVAEAAGWSAGPPADDVDLWTGAAMALISVGVDGVDPRAAACLDAMELDDWLSTILELVRAGPGTAADPESLLALSARCLDVDTAAVDPALAPRMLTAFGVLAPVWRALGAVDAAGVLTPLGAWGLPLALARAWGGWLE
ncbi:MAG TPA: hypothetical protein VGI06_18510 [Acidimicrobiales bacterium]|jgi:hypothetical protein